MDAMPEEKPKVILEAVTEAEPQPAVTLGDLTKVEETPVVAMPVEVTKVEGGSGKWMWVWAVVGLLLGVAVGGGGGYVIWGNKKESAVIRPTPTGAAEKTAPTPTVAVEVKRSELKVQVLNGSGVRGEASKAKALLEGLGYKDVVTGNADREDYEQTEVTAVKGEYWSAVKVDLESKYTVSLKPGTAELGEFDAVVILGGV